MSTVELELCEALMPETEPSPVMDGEGEKYISFTVRGKLCCVLATAVEEVTQPVHATAVPNAPSWLLGLVSYRGEPAAVIDQRLVVNQPVIAPAAKPKMIVFSTEAGSARFVLPIDSVHEFVSLPKLATPSLEDSHTHTVVHEGRTMLVLSHDRLFKDLSETQSA